MSRRPAWVEFWYDDPDHGPLHGFRINIDQVGLTQEEVEGLTKDPLAFNRETDVLCRCITETYRKAMLASVIKLRLDNGVVIVVKHRWDARATPFIESTGVL